MTDQPTCTLDRSPTGPTTCLCTGRPGCQYAAGADVCTDCGETDCYGDCDESYGCADGLQCPCGGDCWDEGPPPRPIETISVAGEVL